MTNTPRIKLFTIIFFNLIIIGNSEAQVQYYNLSEQLLGEDNSERAIALEKISSIEKEFHKSLIKAIEQEAQEQMQRYKAEINGKNIEYPEDPEFTARLTNVVVELRDPRTIPALTILLGTGSTKIPMALAAFGEEAAPAVLSVIKSSQSAYTQVNHGLIALRCMIENLDIHPLSNNTIEEIRLIAEIHLTDYYLNSPGPLAESGVGLNRAIDLAIKLDDPELRKIVEELASDKNAIAVRGVKDDRFIENTRKHAADRLDANPPLPLCN